MWVLRPILAAAAVMLAACAHPDPGSGSSAPAGPLLASLQATTFGADSVRFVLQVTNSSAGPVQLSYSSGQSFDFVVTRGGTQVWRWSAGRMFTEALRSETLPAGGTLTYTAVWHPGSSRGDHVVRGMLTASNQHVEQSAPFRVE